MRIRALNTILFMFFIWSSVTAERIVLDTNACSGMLALFDQIIAQDSSISSYREVWDLFTNADSVNTVLDRYYIDNNKIGQAIPATKRIVDLRENRNDIIFDIPKIVYNEVARFKTSKMQKSHNTKFSEIIQYSEFFNSIPLPNKHIDTSHFDDDEYPEKNIVEVKITNPIELKSRDAQLLEEMKTFLRKTIDKNPEGNLAKMVNSYNGEPNRAAIKDKLTELSKVSENLATKKKLWDDKLKKVLPTHQPETAALASITGKIGEFMKVKIDKINFGDPIDLIARRLLKNDEEFDYFDLDMYLYAKQNDAHIMTFNTQAFQEINDPIFLGYLGDAKILNPNINFQTADDLRNPSDCKSVMEKAIKNDFENDRNKLPEVFEHLLCDDLDSIKLHAICDEIINDFKNAAGKDLKLVLEKSSPFDSLKLLEVDGNNRLKIKRNEAFSSDKRVDVQQKIGFLQFLDKKIFNGQMNVNHFTSPVPIRGEEPRLPRDVEFAKIVNDGLKSPNKNLGNFLNNIKNENAESLNDANAYGRALYLEDNFQRGVLLKAVEKAGVEPTSLAPIDCPGPGGARRRRSTKSCSLTWVDIDEINENHQYPRDPNQVIVNSDKFMQHSQKIDDPILRQQFYQFVDQVVHPDNGFERPTVGYSGPEMKRVLNHNRIFDHFSRVGQVSEALNKGYFAKNVLADLLNGDVKGVAINVGFLVSDQCLSKVAKIVELRGAAFAESGRLLLGNSFKLASPFISRLGSALIIYDLVEQVKALEAGDKDAIVDIVGDSIMIGADAIEIGADILLATGVIASSGPLAPIVATIGAVVFIGEDVYHAVRHVQELDKVLHLSTEEKIEEGIRSIFHYSELNDAYNVKLMNNALAQQAANIVKTHKTIKSFIMPSAVVNPQTNQIESAKDIDISYATDSSRIRWDRTGPDAPTGAGIFCSPQTSFGGTDTVVSPGVIIKCINAIGVVAFVQNPFENVLFNLSNANGRANGFWNSINTFIIESGTKSIFGSNRDDVFSFKGNVDQANVEIDGKDGENILDFSGIISNRILSINFPDGIVYFPNVKLKNVNKFVGRKDLKEIIRPGCDTRYINGQGGHEFNADEIIIERQQFCSYNLTMQLNPHTSIQNNALRGDFTYIVNMNGRSDIFAEIPTYLQNQLNTTHTFVINHAFSDLSSVDIVDPIKNNKFHVLISFRTQYTINFWMDAKNVRIALKDSTELRIQNDGLYAILKTDKTVNEILRVFPTKYNEFRMTILAQSIPDDTSVIIAGHHKHSVFNNDPERNTIILANGGSTKNIFIISGQGQIVPRKVTIFSKDRPNTINTIDLRPLAKQVKNEFQRDLLFSHSIDSNTKMLEINLFEKGSTYILMTIAVANFENRCHNLHIILDKAPVILKCGERYHNNPISRYEMLNGFTPSDHYTPVPMIFEANEIIVITERDIEVDTEIRVQQNIGHFNFVRFGDDLAVTNMIEFASTGYRVGKQCTVLFKDFFINSEFFYTLKLNFYDEHISLDYLRNVIEKSLILEDWLKRLWI